MLPKKILLAEDDTDDQSLFIEFLQEREDIVVLPVAENGVELFDFLQKVDEDTFLPDLIILDQNMPKRNGLQTLALLKENMRFRDIPVVIYSTYADRQLRDVGLEKGAGLVLPKPVSREGYLEMIDTILKTLPG